MGFFNRGSHKINGQAILQKKNFIDLNDYYADFLDRISEFFGRSVSIQLVCSEHPDHLENAHVSKTAKLKHWIFSRHGITSGDLRFQVEMEWDQQMGIPGAILVKNQHHNEFFFKSFTLHLQGNVDVHFDCYSWIYPFSKEKKERIFFSNKNYLPADTPDGLKALRQSELENKRGDGKGERQKWERIYDYDYYNDLGDPDNGIDRPPLGGSARYPYPRRCRTGRPPTRTDSKSESRLFLLDLNIYVPRDERFSQVKMSDFLAYGMKSAIQLMVPYVKSHFDPTPKDFDSMGDVLDLYFGSIKLPQISLLEKCRQMIPLEFFREVLNNDGAALLKYPVPQVIQRDSNAWRSDEEFAREMLAGVNPVVIQRLTKFPPTSELDEYMYGPKESTITEWQIREYLDGLTVQEAISNKRLFLLDHHDTIMPFVNRINALDGVKVYASRTILFLKDDGKLAPVAIELCLPRTDSDPAMQRVFTPAPEQQGLEGLLWMLAKAYVAVNDSGHHQLISHWLLTHAVVEPYAIATNRQLSVLHPLYKLLQPHFRDTLNINAFARLALINGDGILEKTVFPGKFALEMSSAIYKKHWRFNDQALPTDLVNRGMAEEDVTKEHGLRLLIEDYPYAVDGLDIWGAIREWVKDYVGLYYADDHAVCADAELQEWWKEIRREGHGDKGAETWWYAMDCLADLQQALCIIMWVASALHAAVNFGQYAYAGFMPARPTMSRRLLPPAGTDEEKSLLCMGRDEALLRTLTNQLRTTLGIALIEILSRRSADEVYLGQRDSSMWTDDARALAAFQRFTERLRRIERGICLRNADPTLPNRRGPAQVDYTLLYPGASNLQHLSRLDGKGIPNSVSI